MRVYAYLNFIKLAVYYNPNKQCCFIAVC